MTPSWYDTLGVEPEATPEEIRAAWRESVEGLDPTDRRFRQRNRAAEVLLDPQRRAEHDAVLAAEDASLDDEDTAPAGSPGPAAAATGVAAEAEQPTEVAEPRTPIVVRPGRGLRLASAVLAVVAVILLVGVAVAAVNLKNGDGAGSAAPSTSDSGSPDSSALPDSSQVAAAVDAARTAIGPVLSYDYRSLGQGKQLAQSYMTPAYSSEYAQYFAGIVAKNAPSTKTVVTAQVLEAGVVRTMPGRVDVLLFVNRPTTNKVSATTSHDQVTARMVDASGSWLVDCLITGVNGTCGH